MDDLYIMANIANAGTESRRVFYSEEIASIMAEIEYQANREKELRQARAEGEKAVRAAQERRRIFRLERKAKRQETCISLALGIIFTALMFLIPAAVAML